MPVASPFQGPLLLHAAQEQLCTLPESILKALGTRGGVAACRPRHVRRAWGDQLQAQADDELNQAMAISCMPLEELEATARRTWALNRERDAAAAREGEAAWWGVEGVVVGAWWGVEGGSQAQARCAAAARRQGRAAPAWKLAQGVVSRAGAGALPLVGPQRSYQPRRPAVQGGRWKQREGRQRQRHLVCLGCGGRTLPAGCVRRAGAATSPVRHAAGRAAMQERDYLMVELLLWFKGHFFSWVRRAANSLFLLLSGAHRRIAQGPARTAVPALRGVTSLTFTAFALTGGPAELPRMRRQGAQRRRRAALLGGAGAQGQPHRGLPVRHGARVCMLGLSWNTGSGGAGSTLRTMPRPVGGCRGCRMERGRRARPALNTPERVHARVFTLRRLGGCVGPDAAPGPAAPSPFCSAAGGFASPGTMLWPSCSRRAAGELGLHEGLGLLAAWESVRRCRRFELVRPWLEEVHQNAVCWRKRSCQ